MLLWFIPNDNELNRIRLRIARFLSVVILVANFMRADVLSFHFFSVFISPFSALRAVLLVSRLLSESQFFPTLHVVAVGLKLDLFLYAQS